MAALVADGCASGAPAADCAENWTGTMAMSPDGQHLLIAAPDPTWLHLFSLNLKTGSVRRVATGDCDAVPAWSPDGHSIAYIHDGQAVWVKNLRTQTIRHLTGDTEPWDNLAWMPNGQAVLYGNEGISGFGGDPITSVLRAPITGGAATTWVDNADFPALSPGGALTYIPAGEHTLQLSGGSTLVSAAGLTSPAWSPNGRWIAAADSRGIALVNPSLGTVGQLPGTHGDHFPTWAADSSALYLYNGFQIVRYDLTSNELGTVVRLSDLPHRAS